MRPYRRTRLPWCLLAASLAAGCATAPRPVLVPDAPPAAGVIHPDAPAAEVQPLEYTGGSEAVPVDVSPKASQAALAWAEARAIVRPGRKDFHGAEARFPYTPARIWEILTVPFQATHLQFALGNAPLKWSGMDVGDQGWWDVQEYVSGTPPQEVGHLLVTPKAPGKTGKMTVLTRHGAYYLLFKSHEGPGLTAVSWSHPPAPVTLAPPIRQFHTGFARLTYGPLPPWTPLGIWATDEAEGSRTLILFPKARKSHRAPVLYVLDRAGEKQLVPYDVRGDWYVVHRLFERAELRAGHDEAAEVIGVTRGERYRAITCPGDAACPPGGWQ